jgi:hypothetical protein
VTRSMGPWLPLASSSIWRYRDRMVDDGTDQTEASRRLIERARLSVEMAKTDFAQVRTSIAESRLILERAERAIALATILSRDWPVHWQAFEGSQTR